eukprot:NODE_25276_length_593_cov_2.019313.p1 GENE.NODE_25276_length_593_cov_2.019313~~NODE_25276_length_593_cov_2.019313.p1  ORF type:complete len:171 (+),score=20.34 NODE_25276_length_593_cov_2.019313:58-570(+)
MSGTVACSMHWALQEPRTAASSTRTPARQGPLRGRLSAPAATMPPKAPSAAEARGVTPRPTATVAAAACLLRPSYGIVAEAAEASGALRGTAQAVAAACMSRRSSGGSGYNTPESTESPPLSPAVLTPSMASGSEAPRRPGARTQPPQPLLGVARRGTRPPRHGAKLRPG